MPIPNSTHSPVFDDDILIETTITYTNNSFEVSRHALGALAETSFTSQLDGLDNAIGSPLGDAIASVGSNEALGSVDKAHGSIVDSGEGFSPVHTSGGQIVDSMAAGSDNLAPFAVHTPSTRQQTATTATSPAETMVFDHANLLGDQQSGDFVSDPLENGASAAAAIPVARFPDATNTGVPAGTSLTNYTGSMTITTAGTVIENKIINGTLHVDAANVVIKNCIINYNAAWGVEAENAPNIIIQDCDIVGPGYGGDSNAAILGTGTFLRNDISKSENGIVLGDGSSIVRGNYIHNLEDGAAGPHYDGISVQGRQNGVLIENNTVIGRDTSDIFIKNDFGAINDVTIKDNLLLGDPGYVIYAYNETANGAVTNIKIFNNYIEEGYYGTYAFKATTPTVFGDIVYNNGGAPAPGSVIPSRTLVDTAGNDAMYGGFGIDTAVFSLAQAVHVDLRGISGTNPANPFEAVGQGNDQLYGVENVTGSSKNDTIVGNDSNNVLNGAGGTDTMQGLKGDDTYYVSTAGDVVVEGAGQGTLDWVAARVSYALGAGVEIEKFRTTSNGGTAAINLVGNEFDQSIIGNAGANIINCRAGLDTLTGLGGADAFVFDRAPGAANYDHITDFVHGQDKIRLDHDIFATLPTGALSSAAFKDISSAAEDASDRILYKHANGALYYDADGPGGAGPQLIAILDNHPAIVTSADFLVIA